MWQAIARLLSEHIGPAEITEKHKLSDGDIHSAWRITYGMTDIFVKLNTQDMLPLFTAEAEQLELLRRSEVINTPTVYGVGTDKETSFLLLEYIPMKTLDAHASYCLGKQLAHLHQWGEQPQFGLDFDNQLGISPQPNAWQRRWVTFFAEQRIGWQLQLSAEKGMIFGKIDDIVDMVVRRLQHHQPRPSLLHGDLWPENCAATNSESIVFNPASYWGDRECDLAMLPLYSHLPKQIYDGYQSVYPLPSDFIERQPIYQLYYLLNHSNMFGGEHFVIAQRAIEKLMTKQ